MIANRRERLLMVVTGLLVGAWLLDSMWLGPLLERQTSVDRAHHAAQARLRKADGVRRLLPAARTILAEVENELAQTAAKSSAVLDLNQRLSRLATDAGARTDKVNLEGQQTVDAYKEVVYRLDLHADISALQKLLYLLDTSALPLKISTLTISREPRGDDLKVMLRVSMLTLGTNGANGSGARGSQ